jgi:hypothetical protein
LPLNPTPTLSSVSPSTDNDAGMGVRVA